MSETQDDLMRFEFKRSHFYAVTVPLAFLLGLALGYLQWGATIVPRNSVIAAQEELASGGNGAGEDVSAQAEEVSIAEQIANIDRYEIDIAAHDPVFGPENAPVTIIEFSDFECPFCLRHFQETYPRLLENYEGQIRYIFKDLPLTSIHPNAFPAAIAAQCAFEQDAFWPYHDLLFAGSLGLSSGAYEDYANQLNLDMAQFNQCFEESRYEDVVQADLDYALELGARSTPTFFINGIGLVGAQPYEVFAQVIDHELGLVGR